MTEGQAAAIEWYEGTLEELQITLEKTTNLETKTYLTKRIEEVTAHVKRLKQQSDSPKEPIRTLVLQT